MSNDPHNVSGAQFVQPSEEFQIQTQKPNVRFLSKGVQPPSQVYVAQNDDIVIGCASSATGEIVTVSYRLLRHDGVLVLGQFQVQPASDRSVKVYQESLAEGFLLSVSAKAKIATTRGVTFVRIFITDPALGGGQPSYMLMADYVTTAMAPAHPNGRVLAPVEGPGAVRAIQGTTPPLGSNWVISCPNNARWKPRGLICTLATSAVVQNRLASIAISTAASVCFVGAADKVTPASMVVTFGCAALTPYVTPTPTSGFLPLPPELVMLANDSINSTMQFFDAGDQWEGIFLTVEEWLDNV